jgi:hypothetical protein
MKHANVENKGRRALPRVEGEVEWRKEVFERSRTCMDYLDVVKEEIQEAAKKDPAAVRKFLSWAQPDRLMTADAFNRVKKYDRDLRRAFAIYLAFVFRFRVWLRPSPREPFTLIPVYDSVPSPEVREVVVKGGSFVSVGHEEDEDAQGHPAAGGIPGKVRRALKEKNVKRVFVPGHLSELTQFLISQGKDPRAADEYVERLAEMMTRHGCNPEDIKIRLDEVLAGPDAVITKLLDATYDPLTITFMIVESQRRRYLLALVGELVSAKDWSDLAAVRTALHQELYGESPAGRRPNRSALRRNLTESKRGKPAVIDEARRLHGNISPTARRKAAKPLDRAKNKRDKIIKSLLF